MDRWRKKGESGMHGGKKGERESQEFEWMADEISKWENGSIDNKQAYEQMSVCGAESNE